MTTCLVQRYILHLLPVPLSSAPHPSSETISHTNEPLKPYGEWMIVKSKKPSKPSRPTITPADQKASSANHVPKPQHMPIPQHVSIHVIHPPYPLHHVTEHLKMLSSLSILGRIQHPLITIYPLISMQNHLSLQQTWRTLLHPSLRAPNLMVSLPTSMKLENPRHISQAALLTCLNQNQGQLTIFLYHPPHWKLPHTPPPWPFPFNENWPTAYGYQLCLF